MGGDDGADDGEPEPGAAAGAGAGGVDPVEALKGAGHLVLGHARAVVLDDQDGCLPVEVGVHADGRGRVRRGVGPDVGQEVVEHLAEAHGVADHLDGGVDVQADGPAGLDDTRVAHGLGGEQR